MSYIRDPDFSDEAYDLRSDPDELVTVAGMPEYAAACERYRRNLDRFEKECEDLRSRIGIIHGPTGFIEGWE